MSKQQTVEINGALYDAQSGEPLQPTETSSTTKGAHASSVHARTSRSHTLSRKHVVTEHAAQLPRPAKVKRSPHISKFAHEPQAVAAHKRTFHDIGPVRHPIVAKATNHAPLHPIAKTATPKAAPAPARHLKEQAIERALENAQPVSRAQHKTSQGRGRMFNIATASLAILLLAGYLTYLNMPGFSVRMAAIQAGIDATYPEYRPSGYRLDGPVAYKDGEVAIHFASNAGPQKFALNQAKSTWDSSALLTNYVEPAAGTDYETYSDGGLTVYTYGNNAAWVNGGILYTIQGNTLLSNDQILGMATSL